MEIKTNAKKRITASSRELIIRNKKTLELFTKF